MKYIFTGSTDKSRGYYYVSNTDEPEAVCVTHTMIEEMGAEAALAEAFKNGNMGDPKEFEEELHEVGSQLHLGVCRKETK
jgi:hypothetical protein